MDGSEEQKKGGVIPQRTVFRRNNVDFENWIKTCNRAQPVESEIRCCTRVSLPKQIAMNNHKKISLKRNSS